MAKLLEIPMTKKQFLMTKDYIIKMGSGALTQPLQEFLNVIQKDELPEILDPEELFLLTAMARDLLRFKQTTKKLLEFYQDKSQVDAKKVTKARPPEGTKPLTVSSEMFNDEPSDF